MTFSYLQDNLATLKSNNWEPVMSDAAFVLMNCDLIAVPLQVGGSSIVTIYCGARRAIELRDRWNQKAGAICGPNQWPGAAGLELPRIHRIAPREAAQAGRQ
jgi:hypothetical protein